MRQHLVLGASRALAVAVAFALTVAAVPSMAAAPRAPTAEEQKAFADGLRAYDAGDARGAEKAWKAGYSVAHDPAFLVRIGEAQEKAGAPKEALQSYEQYLRESPDAADRADIEGRVRRLAPPGTAKPPIEVETPDELGGSGAPAPTATGATVAPPPAASAPAQVRDDTHEDLVPLVDEEPGARSNLNIAAWVGIGATAALLGVAAFFGASASEKSGDANRLLLNFNEDTGKPQEYSVHAAEFEEDVRIGKRDDRLAKIFALCAGATAIASTVLFVLDSRAEKPGSTVAGGQPRFSVTPTGMRWSF